MHDNQATAGDNYKTPQQLPTAHVNKRDCNNSTSTTRAASCAKLSALGVCAAAEEFSMLLSGVCFHWKLDLPAGSF